MPGKLELAVGKIFGEINEGGDNGWVRPSPAAEAQSSTSSFLLEEDELRYGTCSGTGLALSHQVQATLGSVPLFGLDLGAVNCVSSLCQTFPGQIQTFLPVGSLPGCKARGDGSTSR